MDKFGDVIRLLMDRREIAGNKLAKDIGISPTSVSKILTGQSKPRQITLTRLIQRLCINKEEEQMVVQAFTGLLDVMSDGSKQVPRMILQDELERVTRYLEVRSMLVAFKNDVEAVIKSSNLEYEKDSCSDPFICDFMLKLGGRRVAIDCKYNVNRDWDRTYATVKLLLENMPCDEVLIVAPYENQLVRNARTEIENAGGSVIDVKSLAEFLEKF